LGGLRRELRIHRLCAEFAFRKMQYALRPDEVSILDDAEQLQQEILLLVEVR
jgi:hypothetical protein